MPFNAKGEWVPEDMGVASRVADIAGQDSALNRRATGMGMAVANRRGVLNSSIAAGAATGAVLDRAVPIASQEASQIASMNAGTQNLISTRDQIAAQDRERITNAMSQAGGDYTSGIAQTLQYENVPSEMRTAVQASQRDILTARLIALGKLYGVAPDVVSW